MNIKLTSTSAEKKVFFLISFIKHCSFGEIAIKKSSKSMFFILFRFFVFIISCRLLYYSLSLRGCSLIMSNFF